MAFSIKSTAGRGGFAPSQPSFNPNALLHDPRIPVSGATARDCEKAIETMRLTFQLARSLLRDTIDKLNENLPVTATIDYADQDNLLIDMEGDLIGKIENAAEQV